MLYQGNLSNSSIKNLFLLFNEFLLRSFASGLIAAIMGTPADVVKTRIMFQPTDKSGRLIY